MVQRPAGLPWSLGETARRAVCCVEGGRATEWLRGQTGVGGREPALGDLAQECLVADLEASRRLGPIPLHPLEDLREGPPFGFPGSPSGDVSQTLRRDRGGRGRGVVDASAREQRLE